MNLVYLSFETLRTFQIRIHTGEIIEEKVNLFCGQNTLKFVSKMHLIRLNVTRSNLRRTNEIKTKKLFFGPCFVDNLVSVGLFLILCD